MKHHLKY